MVQTCWCYKADVGLGLRFLCVGEELQPASYGPVSLFWFQPGARLSARRPDVDQQRSSSTCGVTKAEPSQLHHQGEAQVLTQDQPLPVRVQLTCKFSPCFCLLSLLAGGKCNQVTQSVQPGVRHVVIYVPITPRLHCICEVGDQG